MYISKYLKVGEFCVDCHVVILPHWYYHWNEGQSRVEGTYSLSWIWSMLCD